MTRSVLTQITRTVEALVAIEEQRHAASGPASTA